MKNIHEIMVDVQNLKEEFIERKLHLSGQIGLLDKEINSLIKDNAYNNLKNEDYCKELSQKLRDLELKRREIKNEFKIICDIDEGNKFTYNMLGYTVNEYNKVTRVMNRLNETGDFKLKNCGTIEYSIEGKNSFEIDKKVKELKKEYSKVFVDKEEEKIFCYNKNRAV